MHMQLSIETNAKAFEKEVGRVFKDQIPFATQVAVNAVAFKARTELMRQTDIKLHVPTKYTKNGFIVDRARNKREIVATVFIHPIRAKYLGWQIDGGTRTPSGRAIPVPVSMPLNAYGNMRKGSIKRVLGKPNTFSGIPRGKTQGGIYQRMKSGKLKMLVSWEQSANYRKRFPFYQIVNGIVRNTIDKELAKAFMKALKSRR